MRLGATLNTPRQTIRNWQDTEADRAFFHRVNSEEAMLEFFPFRRNRSESDDMFDLMNRRISENGYGWAVAEDSETGAPIGFTGVAKIRHEAIIGAGVEIGWRYVPEAWGKGLASEAARALLVHGFDEMGFSRIAAFAVNTNAASIAVMKRIGMTAQPDLDFDHPDVPYEKLHLKRHVLYEMLASDPRG